MIETVEGRGRATYLQVRCNYTTRLHVRTSLSLRAQREVLFGEEGRSEDGDGTYLQVCAVHAIIFMRSSLFLCDREE